MRDSHHFDIIIAGAGPSGTSAAIYLAAKGLSVLIIEQKKFPRSKLCGEFISPECWEHFARLGVAETMTMSGGATLNQTVFYSRNGRCVAVPSKWFGAEAALGLSRAEMDNKLLERARESGVTVLDNTQACGLVVSNNVVRGVAVKNPNGQKEYLASMTIDATGRGRYLTRTLSRALDQRASSTNALKKKRAQFVAFKTHLKNARIAEGSCEIYVYPGGYGGLNAIEGNVSNLCFIVSAKDARRYNSDPERLIREVLSRNSRAAFTLEHAEPAASWLGVSLDAFGRQTLVPADGLITIGDAAAFIDPFAGSGILMALQSGELAAAVITSHWQERNASGFFASLANDYRQQYARRFESRLRTCGWMRRAAFVPQLAETLILLFSNDWLRKKLSEAMRRGTDHSGEFRIDQTLQHQADIS